MMIRSRGTGIAEDLAYKFDGARAMPLATGLFTYR